ncbi:nuclear transport factor 2 family protein [Candidatus Berkiella cookevillensis]|uniref:Nuclear transport factor 2 family protein n=1 Tax=Candidatus Berkiella cookevillensis TaxID=437022 RepID=A0A0Q9YD79_9GAMM|nr:nuclear transport factor 2 family protein [Candidatus Berkiella cookevillensis]MCS5707928.1 nuclear transport factor 2 family protein [Candidatus Berkiella cookevillensis]
MRMQAISLVNKYYDYFNKRDLTAFLELLDENIVHDINQSETEVGVNAFSDFIDRMNKSYEETVKELIVMATEDGTRAAAEFFIDGIYKATDRGLPLAVNQSYLLRCGAFFEIKSNKIIRVTNYYNMQNWLKQIKE